MSVVIPEFTQFEPVVAEALSEHIVQDDNFDSKTNVTSLVDVDVFRGAAIMYLDGGPLADLGIVVNKRLRTPLANVRHFLDCYVETIEPFEHYRDYVTEQNKTDYVAYSKQQAGAKELKTLASLAIYGNDEMDVSVISVPKKSVDIPGIDYRPFLEGIKDEELDKDEIAQHVNLAIGSMFLPTVDLLRNLLNVSPTYAFFLSRSDQHQQVMLEHEARQFNAGQN